MLNCESTGPRSEDSLLDSLPLLPSTPRTKAGNGWVLVLDRASLSKLRQGLRSASVLRLLSRSDLLSALPSLVNWRNHRTPGPTCRNQARPLRRGPRICERLRSLGPRLSRLPQLATAYYRLGVTFVRNVGQARHLHFTTLSGVSGVLGSNWVAGHLHAPRAPTVIVERHFAATSRWMPSCSCRR